MSETDLPNLVFVMTITPLMFEVRVAEYVIY